MNLRQNVTTAVMTAVACFLLLPAAVADQVINDDLIVNGSECVGFDCVNGETFNADTIRLRENNLRIHFDDTSTSSSFPRNDWRIVANDQANGGASYLGFEDSTAGRFPFRVEAGARANALYVESSGDVGIGTNNPVVELHVKSGDTPTLRLEQDGTSGFQAQTWDIAGNETNFFVRDATNGSTLPFRIRPGAPSSAIDIAGNGDVGMGTSSPGTLRAGSDASLHMRSTDGSSGLFIEEASATPMFRTLFELRNNGAVGFEMLRNSGGTAGWQFSAAGDGDFELNDVGGGDGAEFMIDGDGNATFQGMLTITGGCSGCDAVFTPEYEVESIEEHAESMWSNSYLPGVGPTTEGRTQVNVGQKTLGMLNELEKAHIYIERLNERVRRLEEALAAASK